jgi:pyruvate dehydrogenase E1 component
MKAVADQIAPWLPGRMVTLGTDGFGRSENREHLRKFFEVNAEAIVAATLSRLSREGKFSSEQARKSLADLGIDPEAGNPART